MPNAPEFLMPLTVALIMCGIGLSLKFKDFKRIFVHPKPIITGLVCQLVLLPLIAFGLIYLWPMDPIYKVGIIVIASAPGGTASNLVTHMLKGNVALSVSLTSFNSFAILVTIPFLVGLAITLFLGEEAGIILSAERVAKDIGLTIILPVLLGIVINELTSDRFTQKIKQPLRYIMPGLMVVIFLLATGSENAMGFDDYMKNAHLFIPLILLNLITMLMGFLISRKLRIDHDSSYTIAVEMGLQNIALAIFIAAQILDRPEIELVAIMYSSFSLVSTWFFAWLMKHYLPPKAKNPSN